MPTKTYGIYGKSTAVLVFGCGRSSVKATFSRGIPDRKTNKPATVSTDNSVAQFIIENDPKFGTLVKLLSTYPTASEREAARRAKEAADETAKEVGTETKTVEEAPETARPVEGAVTERAMGADVHDEVTTFNEAREVLMDLGATAKETISKQACRATAERYNVVFPNWR